MNINTVVGGIFNILKDFKKINIKRKKEKKKKKKKKKIKKFKNL